MLPGYFVVFRNNLEEWRPKGCLWKVYKYIFTAQTYIINIFHWFLRMAKKANNRNSRAICSTSDNDAPLSSKCTEA